MYLIRFLNITLFFIMIGLSNTFRCRVGLTYSLGKTAAGSLSLKALSSNLRKSTINVNDSPKSNLSKRHGKFKRTSTAAEFQNQRKRSTVPALTSVPSPYPRSVILQEGKGRLFKDGNPIIYNGAIEEVRDDPKDGDDVYVLDHKGNLVGRGFFNSKSQYRVRLFAKGYEEEVKLPVESVLSKRIHQAMQLRNSLTLPSPQTNAFRLVNGEGDQLSGLIVDVFDRLATIQSSALWCEKYADSIRNAVKQALRFSDDQIVWKRAETRLAQDGWQPRVNISSSSETDNLTASLTVSTVRENGIRYSLDPENSQKTGFYCDQRDNRLLIRKLAQGKHVLDLYCYTGGFSLNSAVGGAASVLAVDSSLTAIESLKANIELNKDILADTKLIDTIEGDCPTILNTLISEGKSFDLVICDPPKLAPSRHQLDKAISKYTQINSLAMQVLPREGGLLFTCSCSAAMTQSGEFSKMLQQAARSAKRRITILGEFGAANDHTSIVGFPEGKYLTAILLHVL